NVRNPADWPRLEAQVLELAVRDADARAKISALVDEADAALQRAGSACGSGLADRVPDGPSLAAARLAMENALAEANYGMVVSYRRDELSAGLSAALVSLQADRLRVLGPEPMKGELERAAADLRRLAAGFRYERIVHNRLRDILTSDLPGPAAPQIASSGR
ncbi:MAG TPA: hypothetical protein VFU47_05600, partial [Armatimonadota bacterium]|nr:hypothetical protein [Armatimonadota bacterium]